MNFYRLIKPQWGKPFLDEEKKEPNPGFVQEIPGKDTIDGCNLTEEFLRQKNNEGYNIYFFPNHPSTDIYKNGEKWMRGKMVDVFKYVFVDMDLKDGEYKTKNDFLNKLGTFPLKPTMVVDSGNGIHAYWRVTDLTRDTFVISQVALLNHFKTDKSVFTVLQLMRLPGYYNTKKFGEFKPAAIVESHSSNLEYTQSQFPQEMFNLTDDQVLKAKNHLNRLDGKDELHLEQDVNIDELPDEFVNLCLQNDDVQNLFRDPTSYNGDRSSADMKLANTLYSRGFSKKDALRVLANTQKALSKGANRYGYAQLTVGKVYFDRTKNHIPSVGEALRNHKEKVLAPAVKGPYFMDYSVLEKQWRKKQILGLIAGSGVGKTAVALFIIKEMIKNNTENDDVFVFVTLEMAKEEIYERWIDLVGADSPLADRLYVISNEDDDGTPRNIGLQEIYEFCNDIKKVTGKEIGALIIDHFRIISSHINMHKKYQFAVTSEQGSGHGNVRNLSENKKADALKILVKMLNTYLIILTQTTKEKGVGDLPIGKDGAFGTSSFENIVDRLITCWQPLMRIQHLTPLRFLAWQYTKNRHIGKADQIRVYEPKLLSYNMTTGDLAITSEEEFRVFQELEPEAVAAREAISKKRTQNYSLQIDIADIDKALKNLRLVKK